MSEENFLSSPQHTFISSHTHTHSLSLSLFLSQSTVSGIVASFKRTDILKSRLRLFLGRSVSARRRRQSLSLSRFPLVEGARA
jgi:hypothetical protein